MRLRSRSTLEKDKPPIMDFLDQGWQGHPHGDEKPDEEGSGRAVGADRVYSAFIDDFRSYMHLGG